MNDQILKQGYGFATYPSVKLLACKKTGKSQNQTLNFKKELLFGDCIIPVFENGKCIEETIAGKNYVKVKCRNTVGFILADSMQPERILEVNFIDVAQGDGCHIVTPDDQHFLIDTGKSDNMYRFLNWRFNLKNANTAPPSFTAVITHSDEDHYGGFDPLFSPPSESKNRFLFTTIFHNGLVEESGTGVDTLGTVISEFGKRYITNLCDSDDDFKNRLASVKNKGTYIKMLEKTDAPKKSLRLGCDPIYQAGNMKMEVMGPVAQQIFGKDALPVVDSNKGKTKNGHSVIIKITIGKLRLLVGGDLNSAAENYLFNCYVKSDPESLIAKIDNPRTTEPDKLAAQAELDSTILKMREYFEVDIAKSCHHGSADFTNEFLQVLNPIATIISSGDAEPHCHPRPDALGTIGKFSRGKRSLIFSTELARSTKEFVCQSDFTPGKIRERTVTVYGMINIRTDGLKTIIAQKLEMPAANSGWDIHKLEWNTSRNEFKYVV